jgi:hypothetical protein
LSFQKKESDIIEVKNVSHMHTVPKSNFIRTLEKIDHLKIKLMYVFIQIVKRILIF